VDRPVSIEPLDGECHSQRSSFGVAGVVAIHLPPGMVNPLQLHNVKQHKTAFETKN
jgi:hypothetical protein